MLRWLVPASLFLLACTREVELFAPEARDGSVDIPSTGGRDGGDQDGGGSSSGGAQQDGGSPGPHRATVAAGLNHACAIRDGVLFCWGEGTFGRLGVGDERSRDRPTRVDARDDWVSACGGEEHTCAIREDRSVHCWGHNHNGQLGVGDTTQRDRPSLVADLSLVRIACGGHNTCGLTADEALYCWGDNYEGKLGQADPFDSPNALTPVRVASGTSFRDVSVGQGHACAITRAGQLLCWGRNTEGQLGLGVGAEGQLRAPVEVSVIGEVRDVSAGQRHTCAIDVDGALWCWGTDGEGSLGLGVADSTARPSPTRVGNATDWLDVSVRWFHGCARRAPGELYCWGRGVEGQLGTGDATSSDVPRRVGVASDWSEMQVGGFHSCAVAEGDVYCWGANEAEGMLGLGDQARRNEPTVLTFP